MLNIEDQNFHFYTFELDIEGQFNSQDLQISILKLKSHSMENKKNNFHLHF